MNHSFPTRRSSDLEASRVSGGSVGRTALRVSLPLVLPAIMGAGLLLVIEGLSLYSAPVIIAPTAGIDVLSVRMVRMLTVNYPPNVPGALRSEEHTSELQSLMRNSYAVFCLT